MDSTLFFLMLAGFLAGFSKMSVGGMGMVILPVVMIAIPGPEALAVILPMYIIIDIMAVCMYRKKINWKVIFRLLPTAAMGVAIGGWVLSSIDAQLFKIFLGLLIFFVIGAGFWLDKYPATFMTKPSSSYIAGLLGGFISLVVNAAGPFLNLFLVEQNLGKQSYVSTRAMLFLIINLLKVPTMIVLGLLNQKAVITSLYCLPGLILGALCGYWFLNQLNLKNLKWIIRLLAILAAINLILFAK